MTNINYKYQYFKLQDYLSKYYNIKVKLQPDVTDAWYPFLNLIIKKPTNNAVRLDKIM